MRNVADVGFLRLNEVILDRVDERRKRREKKEEREES